MVLSGSMIKKPQGLKPSEIRVTASDFLASYNQNMPEGFPRVSAALMKKFKEEHPLLFKRDDLWSLDQHRKKLIDWLPRNVEVE